MADLAIGISKTAVQLLTDKVKSAIKEEAEKWQIVERDLVFITGEFEMMQSFLDTADEEHVKDKVVRTWVRQVRDLSYDVEDCIEFVLQLDTKKRSWWLRLVPSCKAGAALPVDEVVAETTLLRARVVDVSQRNIRYNLIVDSGPRTINQVQRTTAASSKSSSVDMLINAVEKSGLLDLAGLITREDGDLQVISVCGPEGDIGKVAITRKMYNDTRIHMLFQCRAWVKLMDPFNPDEFIRSLMTQFYTHSCRGQAGVIVGLDVRARMQVTPDELIKLFAQKVNTQRYLIVLEDLYTMVQWDAIRSYLPDMNKGSRIVILTHQPVIASQCTGEPCQVSDLGKFSPDGSVRVYFKEGIHSFTKEEPYDSLLTYGILGRDTEVESLLEQIHEHRLISLWGMPGVGKSCLVGAIYSRSRDIFGFHAWASVSHPFNPTDFSRSLLQGRYQAEDPIQKCRLLLQNHQYLVVIDGLKYKEDWDWIKSNLIGSGRSDSCIITITSEESVAKHCAVSSNNAVVHNIKVLETGAALELFIKVPEENGSYVEWQMKQEADLILSMCGGLPKVIVTLARYLASRPSKDVLKQEMRRLSNNFMQELETNPEFNSLRGILAWMHSYFHACPRHLKKCMLYLSIFPQDRTIQRRRLVRRWIAEGYSKGTDSISLEKYAEKLFEEVAALSIMQPVVKASKVIAYRVNGFFREYIFSRPVEERIFFPAEVSALEKGHGSPSTEGIGQHLAIGSTWEENQVLLESLDFSRLRSLTVFGYFFYVSDRMRVLRVLDLENAGTVWNSDFEKIGKLLHRLKFLSLRGQKEVSRVPDSVGELMQLQTLDIRDTSIVTLPRCITRLQKLQCIRAGTTIAWKRDDSLSVEEHLTPSSRRSNALPSRLLARFRRHGPDTSSSGGVQVPRGIVRLKALLTLGAIHVNNADRGAIQKEIVFLSRHQLKKLEVSGINRKTRISFFDFLRLQDHLESLSLQFEKKNYFVGWHYLGLTESLRSLKMQGHVEQLAPKIKYLVNLLKLTLEKTTLFTRDDIKVLGSLPSLHTLRLRVGADQEGELQFPSGLFRKLEILEIACISKLHVRFDQGAMEKLEQLKIHCLQGSEMQFSGLEHLVSLKQVWLLGYFDDALKQALQEQLDRHSKKSAPKLEVEPRPKENSETERLKDGVTRLAHFILQDYEAI